ncbi:MAG: SBBP repeat-containing protein, partial [Actinomycetota bacterium]
MAGRDSSLFSRDRSASERVRLGRLLATLLFAGALLPAAGPSSSAAARPSTEPAQASETAIEAQLGSLPLYFVANRGQADERVNFYVQGSETNVYFTNRGITYLLSDRDSDKRWAVKLDFVGANQVTPQGRGRTPATINYFKGPQEDWKTDIPTYSGLVYRDLWDGIDLVYSGTASSLKQSFVVHPGADPDDIRLAYRGATSVHKNPVGEITVTTPVGGFSDARPRSFQRVRGERATVESSHRLETARKETRTYGFKVGYYDRTRTLVIDPEVVVYAGYIGGSGQDQGFGIAVDGAGAAYVTGLTSSTEATFPATGGPDLFHNGGGDAFVAKVVPGGGSLAYAGYLGGSGADEGRGIAVDGSGAAYVTGRTDSTAATFPVTGGLDLSHNGFEDAFVAKVAPGGGSLAYAGYLGGSGTDFGNGIAVDGSGAAYVSGFTHSTEATFPATGGPDLSHNGSADAFVAKVAPGGGSLAYAGYLGGSGTDEGHGIAVDGSGAAYVTGFTDSSAATFPVTGGPDLSHNGVFDAFVAKVSPGG